MGRLRVRLVDYITRHFGPGLAVVNSRVTLHIEEQHSALVGFVDGVDDDHPVTVEGEELEVVIHVEEGQRFAMTNVGLEHDPLIDVRDIFRKALWTCVGVAQDAHSSSKVLLREVLVKQALVLLP